MSDPAEVTITGLCNLRPVPGVRDGLVLRGDVPCWLTAEEFAQVCPIATQIDLRRAEEADVDGSGPLAELGVARHHLPYGEGAKLTADDVVEDDLVGQYRIFARMGLGTVIAGFELLTRVELPALIHCTAGKDRTGVFAFALSRALEVPVEDAVADFMASATAIEEVERRFWQLPSTALRKNPVPPGAYSLSPSLAAAIVDVIESAGGVEGWLQEGGAAPDLLERLRSRLG